MMEVEEEISEDEIFIEGVDYCDQNQESDADEDDEGMDDFFFKSKV